MFCLGWACLILFPTGLASHALSLSEAKINIYSDGKFEIRILSSTFSFILENNHPDRHPFEEFAQMSEEDIASRLEAAKTRFLDQFSLQSGRGTTVPVEKISFLTVERVRKAVARLQQKGQELVSPVILEGHLPKGTRSLNIRFPPGLGDMSLGIVQNDYQILPAAQWGEPIMLAGGNDGFSSQFAGILWSYVRLGFEHIVPRGADHILFVLGLFLFQTTLRPLLWQSLLFTLAHSATLALSIYGIFSLPAALVEPLIGVSIVFIAFENMVSKTMKLRRSLLVFGFGLIHGLGFAEILHSLDLAEDDYLTALAGFNMGVELGQIVVILLAFLLLGWSLRYSWYHAKVRIPLSFLIALVGTYWTIERIAA
ncbi:MAG: HupE/UreJ family protein [SAR324 cluster bacterium]|nr:HupE/UreJ family protein [SAR324 cluster bacterium]